MTKKVDPHEPVPGLEHDPVHRPSAHDTRYVDGKYLVSPLPIAPPVGYVKSPTITEQIRAMVRSEHLRREAEAAGLETFEEADDFDVGDDYDPTSPYEVQFDPPVAPAPEAPAPTSTTPPEPGQEAPKRSSEPTPPSSDPGAGGSTS